MSCLRHLQVDEKAKHEEIEADEPVTEGKNESILQAKLRKVVVLIGKLGQ